MKKLLLAVVAAAALGSIMTGCQSWFCCNRATPKDELRQCQAIYVNLPEQAVMDFNAPCWKNAVTYQLQAAGTSLKMTEGGAVKMLWNDRYLFFNVEFIDSDIVQELTKDGEHFYKAGDLVELFIKPAGCSAYWEIFVTPNMHKTTFFYPSAGRRLPSSFAEFNMPGMIYRVALSGSLNNLKDRDQRWQAIVGISFDDLRKSCGKTDFNGKWLLQVSRYNYSVHLDECEFSQLGNPKLATANYHHFPSYAELSFNKK